MLVPCDVCPTWNASQSHLELLWTTHSECGHALATHTKAAPFTAPGCLPSHPVWPQWNWAAWTPGSSKGSTSGPVHATRHFPYQADHALVCRHLTIVRRNLVLVDTVSLDGTGVVDVFIMIMPPIRGASSSMAIDIRRRITGGWSARSGSTCVFDVIVTSLAQSSRSCGGTKTQQTQQRPVAAHCWAVPPGGAARSGHRHDLCFLRGQFRTSEFQRCAFLWTCSQRTSRWTSTYCVMCLHMNSAPRGPTSPLTWCSKSRPSCLKIVSTSLQETLSALAGEALGAPAPSSVLVQARRCTSRLVAALKSG